MALVLVSLSVVQPTAVVATGDVLLVVNTPSGTAAPTAPVTVSVPGLTSGAVAAGVSGAGYYYVNAATPPGSYVATFVTSDSPVLTIAAPFAVYALPVLSATPPALTAAHIPALVLVRAAPVLAGAALAPSAVLLCLDVAAGTGWREVATMRQVCDATLGTARFDLSEYLKGGFAQTPPDETGGNDPALAFRYRVRVGNASTGYTGAPGTEAASFTALAVNAAQVVNPAAAALPLPLGPVQPYASVPVGYARFRSIVADDASGVFNDPTAIDEVPGDWPCPVRQFVWLDVAGAWCWGFFAGRHEHGTETSDGLSVRRAGGVEKYLSRGDVRRTLRVYSDKVERATFDVLVGIRDSLQVYERLASGQYVPVVVEPGSFRDYQETDKTFTVDFLARYPVLARQTQ